MAKKKIKPILLDKVMGEILEQYGDDVYEVLDDCVKDVSEEAAQKLRGVSSFATGGHTKYSSSWTSEKKSGRTQTKATVYNEEHYRLTHLLEKGHVIRNGTGRTFGKTGAYPHIAPVSEWVDEELPKKVERGIKSI